MGKAANIIPASNGERPMSRSMKGSSGIIMAILKFMTKNAVHRTIVTNMLFPPLTSPGGKILIGSECGRKWRNRASTGSNRVKRKTNG